MEAAFAEARRTLDDFLAIAANPAPGLSDFGLKVRMPAGERSEYFWLKNFTRSGNSFSGHLDNDGTWVDLKKGDIYKFSRDEIFDWMYFDDSTSRMHGNFTTCALLVHEDPAEARVFMAEHGMDCEGL